MRIFIRILQWSLLVSAVLSALGFIATFCKAFIEAYNVNTDAIGWFIAAIGLFALSWASYRMIFDLGKELTKYDT